MPNKAVEVGLPKALGIKLPTVPRRQHMEWRIILELSDLVSALLSFGLARGLSPLSSFGLFLPFGMGMFTQCLYSHSILEINNLVLILQAYR